MSASMPSSAKPLLNKRLLIVGGEYDERQADRLKTHLGVQFPKWNWVSGSPVKITSKLPFLIKNADLVLCFIKSTGHNQFNAARKIAKANGLPCVVSTSLSPERVAHQFMHFSSLAFQRSKSA